MGLLSATTMQTWRVMQYLSVRVSFVICQMTEEKQEGAITGLSRDCISLLLLSSPPSLFAPIYDSAHNFTGYRLQNSRYFLYFFITKGDEVTSQFVSVCNVRKSVSMLFPRPHRLFNPFSLFLSVSCLIPI